MSIKRITAAAITAAALVTGLAACGSSPQAAETVTADSSTDDLESSLKTTAQGYIDAFLAGNLVGLSSYYKDDCDDVGGLMLLGGDGVKQMFAGVTAVKVTEVKVEGTRGLIVDTKVEGKPSDATKRLLEGDTDTSDDGFFLADGKWWSECSEKTESAA